MRTRPFRRVSCRFGLASVRSAQRNIYRVRGHVRYLGRPGAHKFQHFRCAQTVPYFSAPTSAPGTLRTTKPPPEVPNRVPGSLSYPLDTVVTVDGRLGELGCGRGPDCSPANQQAPKPQILPNQEQEPVPMGRGARNAYRWVPREPSDPPWSVGTNLGEESTEYDR